jgi:chorismate mutase
MDKILQNFRDEIDDIDSQLVSLLQQRMQVVTKVADHKRATKQDSFMMRPHREEEVLAKVMQTNQDNQFLTNANLYKLWRVIIMLALQHEKKFSIACLNNNNTIKVAYTHFSAISDINLFDDYETIFSNLHDPDNDIDLAVVSHFGCSRHKNWWKILWQYPDTKILLKLKNKLVIGRENITMDAPSAMLHQVIASNSKVDNAIEVFADETEAENKYINILTGDNYLQQKTDIILGSYIKCLCH